MKKIIEYLMIYSLSGTFLFFGKVFVYMLGDKHAFGDSGLSRFLCKLNQPIYEKVSSP